MRDGITDSLAYIINYLGAEKAKKTFDAFDIREHEFFFTFKGRLFQAYEVEGKWYCKS